MERELGWWKGPFWGTFWGQFWVEILGGIVGSFIFLYLVLFLFRPKITIAPFLIKIDATDPEKAYYIFKFVNRSYFSAHELKIELFKLVAIPMGDGQYNYARHKLTISNGDVSELPARPFTKTKTNPHCLIIRTFDDINRILKEEANSVQLRVSLKHGLTGLSEVYDREYAHEGDIKKGKFKPGRRFEVVG